MISDFFVLGRFCSPRGIFVDYVFLKVEHLTSFLQHVGHLAVRAFGRYSVLFDM